MWYVLVIWRLGKKRQTNSWGSLNNQANLTRQVLSHVVPPPPQVKIDSFRRMVPNVDLWSPYTDTHTHLQTCAHSHPMPHEDQHLQVLGRLRQEDINFKSYLVCRVRAMPAWVTWRTLSQNKRLTQGWGYSAVVECLPSMHKALGSSLSTAKEINIWLSLPVLQFSDHVTILKCDWSRLTCWKFN